MGEVTESDRNSVAETDPGYGQLFAVLIRRRFWLLGVFCIVFSIATVLSLTAKPTYQSSMQLLVEPNYQGKKGETGKETQFADSNVEIDNATQLNLMRSSMLIEKAVELLRQEYPDITVKEIKKSLVLTQVLEEEVNTKIFEAVYTTKDPIKAQKVLNAIQKVYQDYNLEQQNQRLTKGLAFINEQLPEVQNKVNKAEASLEQFRKSQNLVDPELQTKALIDDLEKVKQEQQTNRAQLEELQARYIALQKELASSTQDALISSRLSQSVRYQMLLNEIQKTELTLAQERSRFKEASPIIQRLLEQRQRQLALLQEEVGRVLGINPAQIKVTGESLLSEGQLSSVDQNLTTQLVEVQNNLLALEARGKSLAQTEQKLGEELNRFPSLLAEYGRLQPEVQMNRETLQQLLKARQELSLEIARGGFDWQVVEKPQVGLETAPKKKQILLMGVVVGLILGGVAAFVRDAIDDSVHSSDDLTKQLALPLLGITPELPRGAVGDSIIKLPLNKPQSLTPSTNEVIPWSPFRESLDLIYKNIQLLNSENPFKSLMVTSALAGEGKSTLALGLAISAARLHQRVLLIDADLRRPSLHKQLNLPNDCGLSTLLSSDGSVSSESAIQQADYYCNISILTSGPTPSDPAKLLSSRRLGELMATFEQNYDLVLLDAPPVLGIVDAILTASFCSGVVMVGRINQVTRTKLNQAIAMLSKLNVIGVIANGADSPIYSYTSLERKT